MAPFIRKALFLNLVLCALSFAAPRPMALVIMLDGQRADSLDNLEMPYLAAVREGKWQPGYNCAWSDSALTIPDARPSSAANHTAIATGVTATKNNVFSNNQFKQGKYDEWPTWLTRVKAAKPDLKALYMFSWKPDELLGPTETVESKHGSDFANCKELAERYASADNAPDVTLLFIDIVDSGGHHTGFYPYGSMYKRNSYLTDILLKDVFEAIRNRPTFKDEDWLIVITADHGGYAKSHGMWGGQATTIPFIVVSRHVQNGRIAGMPRNCDAAATALDHFGLYSKELNLDGVPRGKELVAEPPRQLKDGLAAYFRFDEKKVAPVNHAGTDIAAKIFGAKSNAGEKTDGFVNSCLHLEPEIKTETKEENGAKVETTTVEPAGVTLEGTEKLQLENGSCFTVAAWVRVASAPQVGTPVIVSNKDWSDGANPGFAMMAACVTERVKIPAVGLNYACSDEPKRLDVGTYDYEPGKWSFYAMTFTSNGTAYLYQGRDDGYFHWIAEHAEKALLTTDLPWHIGQDGTGKCPHSFQGDIDDLAIWTRALTTKELRAIYDAGRKGLMLADLIK